MFGATERPRGDYRNAGPSVHKRAVALGGRQRARQGDVPRNRKARPSGRNGGPFVRWSQMGITAAQVNWIAKAMFQATERPAQLLAKAGLSSVERGYQTTALGE